MGEMTAVRDAYGTAPRELGGQDLRAMGPEADMASPTKSGIFRNTFLERHLNMGISELNMVFMAAGPARADFIPFVNIFTVFLITRGADPIQSLIAYDKLNVKLCGAYYGLSDSYDGTSHQTVTDMAFVRSVPNITVISTTGGSETGKAVFAITKHQGLVYLRLSHAPAPVFCRDDMRSEIGEDIRIRKRSDVAIITMRTLLHNATQAAIILEAEGVRAAVMDMHTIKPAGRNLILERAEQTGAVVTVKEHGIYGSLDNAVAGVLTEHCPVFMERVRTVDFTESGNYGQLMEKYGYGPESITLRCRAMMGRRQDNET